MVESYPSIYIINNKLGWDIKITKEEATNLLRDGFGPNKIFARMQISRKNY